LSTLVVHGMASNWIGNWDLGGTYQGSEIMALLLMLTLKVKVVLMNGIAGLHCIYFRDIYIQ
jgi:hypothetical protein